MTATAHCVPDPGAPTPGELAASREWTDLCLPAATDATPPPTPGLRVLYASHKTVLRANAWGEPIRLGERTFEHGIYVDASHRLRVTLDHPAARFRASVGIDNNADARRGATMGHGSSTFHVLVGGTEAFATGVVTLANSPTEVDAPLDGATEFELHVGDAGDRAWDQSDWADARVVYEDGTEAYLDSFGLEKQLARQMPFSFTYGGKPSAQLLPTWERTVSERPLDGTRTLRTIAYKDPATGLTCQVQATLFADFPAADWVLTFTNEGRADTPILDDVQALDCAWPVGDDEPVTLRRSLGGEATPTAFQPIVEQVTPGGTVAFAPSGGRSSNGTLPFYRLEWPGGGACFAVGWSGQWHADVQRQGQLRVRTGMEQVHTVLRPGESIRSPRVLMVLWRGDDWQRAHNIYRRLAFAHYMPRVGGQLVYPIIAHPSSYDELRNSNEQNQMDILRATAEAGFEGYWLDAYWFEGYFPEGVGNWTIPIEETVRKKDYPHGIRPLSDAAHAAGLKFILWFEPERVAPGTRIGVEHPEWVLRVNNGPGGLLNLGDPAARKWMTDYLCRCIEAYDLDVLRIDFNIDPLPFWRAADTPDRQGIAEIRYNLGLYEMWDEILYRFPKLWIDNCASGGRRIDLETNRRSLPMWRSDYNDNNVMRGDSIADQGMTIGLSQFMPLNAGPAWRSDPYTWRSSSVGGPIPYWDPRPTDYSRDECKQAVAESGALRPYFQGDLWLLTDNSVDPKAWAAYQYNRPVEGDGFACFFRRQDSPYPAFEAALRGLAPEQRYDVQFCPGYAPARTAAMTGAELQALRVDLPRRGTSLVVRYKAVGQ